MNVLGDLLNLKYWIILLISDSCFFKAKFISGYYWITSQLSWEAAWLLVKCGSPVYLVVDELRPCDLWLLMIGLIVVLLTLFWHGEYGFTYRELMLFYGIGMEFKDKILLYCFREVKCKKGFTTGTWYYLYICLGVTINKCIRGLMVSESEFMYDDLGSFPGWGE